MKFEKDKLTSYIFDQIQSKQRVTNGESGEITKQLKDLIEKISDGICQVQNEWQQNARVNNIQVFGGICLPNGPLVIPATGIGLFGCITQKINSPKDIILSNFPDSLFIELNSSTKTLVEAISLSFIEVFNQWVDLLAIKNFVVASGTCTCQLILLVPTPGTYLNGIGVLDKLVENISMQFQTDVLLAKIIENIGPSLKMSVDGVITTALAQTLESICDGMKQMFDEWYEGTKIVNLQVNGGVTNIALPLFGAIGNNGELI